MSNGTQYATPGQTNAVIDTRKNERTDDMLVPAPPWASLAHIFAKSLAKVVGKTRYWKEVNVTRRFTLTSPNILLHTLIESAGATTNVLIQSAVSSSMDEIILQVPAYTATHSFELIYPTELYVSDVYTITGPANTANVTISGTFATGNTFGFTVTTSTTAYIYTYVAQSTDMTADDIAVGLKEAVNASQAPFTAVANGPIVELIATAPGSYSSRYKVVSYVAPGTASISSTQFLGATLPRITIAGRFID